ncbi:hypothetical protein ACFS5N_14450 [Mucilaginibacter ximonensis]|uniref:Uncharacterized protein n=1 Tax=Mucilaginibacter ximonensis TaxID=538021 RepID=A0ABW5YEG1_9SPHI
MEFFEEINNLRWISLVNITEAKLALNIRIIGAVDLSADILATAYNIHFNNYAAYCVIDESYRKQAGDNAALFRTFTQSNYLDFLQLDTTTGDPIAELKHYAFYCLNHIIHVAAFEEPVIVKG